MPRYNSFDEVYKRVFTIEIVTVKSKPQYLFPTQCISIPNIVIRRL